MKRLQITALLLIGALSVFAQQTVQPGTKAVISARDFMAQKLYTCTEATNFITGHGSQFARFDPEVGWVLRDARWSGSVNNMLQSNGVEGATWETTFDHDKNYRRHLIAYANKPCRINTYGDSFTHGDQVNDGETWQEFLAANLREPVQNFGVGGYSVYQAYLRMLREEKTSPAELIIFNIFADDHYRNVGAWGTIRCGKDWRFMWTPAPYLTVDLSSGKAEAHPNPCPVENDFYRLCDLDWCEKRFKDDFTFNIMLAMENAKAGKENEAWDILQRTAKFYGMKEELPRSGSASDAIWKWHTQYALLSTMQVVEWVDDYARQNNKKVLFVLSYWACLQGDRFDQPLVDFLNKKGVNYVDLQSLHRAEFNNFKGTIEEYNRRYWDGHYNAAGNFFTSVAIRDKVVSMLFPKPPAYQPLQ